VTYKVRLENFEGPFDLLIHLIEKAEIDIHDIPIARITEDYLGYLAGWEDINIDAASEFLLLASRLIEIKSKILLPVPREHVLEGDLDDPRDELVERLLEYRLFRQLAATLKEIALTEGEIFSKGMDKSSDWFPEGQPLEGVTLLDLTNAFWAVLEGMPEPPLLRLSEKKLSVEERIEKLCNMLESSGSGLLFGGLFPSGCNRLEIIVTFLALLELIHRGYATACQEENFGDIFIHWYGRL